MLVRRAEVKNLPMLSAHADAEEILRWLCNFRRPPRIPFVTHGEPTASLSLSSARSALTAPSCRSILAARGEPVRAHATNLTARLFPPTLTGV